MALKQLRDDLYELFDELTSLEELFRQFVIFRRLARYARLGIPNPEYLLPLRNNPFPGEAMLAAWLIDAPIEERKEAASALTLVREILSERHCASTARLRGNIPSALLAEARVEMHYQQLPALWRW